MNKGNESPRCIYVLGLGCGLGTITAWLYSVLLHVKGPSVKFVLTEKAQLHR